MKLSIVTTLYRSEDFVDSFYKRVSVSAQQIAEDYEIIFVDDGSPDNSLAMACGLVARDKHVRVIELSRNFGHHKAMMTGLKAATGDFCFLIDSDLEEPPEILDCFVREMSRSNVDVVYGYQEVRKGRWVERVFGALAFRVFNLLLTHKVPANHVTARLMTNDYVQALVSHGERATVIGGLWVITGFRQIGLPVEKSSRPGTSYSILRRWAAFIDSVVSFSEKPLVGIFYLGLAISALSMLIAIGLFIFRIFSSTPMEGWVSVMLSVWFLGGLMIFCVGIVGIYISKVFIETKNRPYTIIRRIYEQPDSQASNHRRAKTSVGNKHRSRQ